MKWKKCASVSPGGKPYFYHLRTLENHCINVSWNRGAEQWSVSYGPNYTKDFRVLFPTSLQAKRFVDRNLALFNY